MKKKSINLQPYNIKRPTHVRWNFPYLEPHQEPWVMIRNKDLRRGLKNYEEIVRKNEITWEFRPLPVTEFEAWIAYYKKQMVALEFSVLANTDKFNQFINKGRELFTFDIYLAGELKGRKLITFEHGKATSCFKASEHVPRMAKKISLGALLDYLMLKVILQKKDVQSISFGRSENEFGVSCKIGYLAYKFQFGQVVSAANAENLNTVEVNPEGYAFFYAFDEKDDLKLYSIKPKKPDENYEMIKKIAPEGVIELEVND